MRRTIETNVEEQGDGCRAVARLIDPFHDIEVTVQLRRADLTITAAVATMRWIPYADRCPDSLLQLGELVGVRVGPSLGRTVREKIGGEAGCPYVVELVLQACQFGLVTMMTQKARDAVLVHQDPGEFAELRRKMGQCAGHRDLAADRLPAWLEREQRQGR